MSKRIYKRYLRKVKRIYTGKRAVRKAFLMELEDSLLTFIEENPDATYADLVDRFGNPTELEGKYSFFSNEEIYKRNMILYWSLIVVFVVVTSSITLVTLRHFYYKYENSKGYYIESFEDDSYLESHNYPEVAIVTIHK